MNVVWIQHIIPLLFYRTRSMHSSTWMHLQVVYHIPSTLHNSRAELRFLTGISATETFREFTAQPTPLHRLEPIPFHCLPTTVAGLIPEQRRLRFSLRRMRRLVPNPILFVSISYLRLPTFLPVWRA